MRTIADNPIADNYVCFGTFIYTDKKVMDLMVTTCENGKHKVDMLVIHGRVESDTQVYEFQFDPVIWQADKTSYQGNEKSLKFMVRLSRSGLYEFISHDQIPHKAGKRTSGQLPNIFFNIDDIDL